MYRICFINSMRSWGGAEVWMLETAAALQRRGVAAELVAQPDSVLHARARDAGVPVAAIPIRFDAAPWTIARLATHLRRAQVTAIVANLTKDLKAAAVAGHLAGVPVILGSRESDFPLKNKAYYRWYFGRLATGVLVNSRATRDTVVRSAPWLDRDRIHLLYKGVDLERFTRRKQAPGAGVVGFVGQLIERKGLRDLMSAWDRLEAGGPGFRLPEAARVLIAGEGPLRETLDTWRRRLRRPERVVILGYRDDIASFYHELDVLVMPSRAEGFGLAAAEAAACGVPVVATDASSLPEIVVHERTGLLVPPDDPTALARGVARLLGDPTAAARLGRAGREHVAREFPQSETLRRLLALTGGPSL